MDASDIEASYQGYGTDGDLRALWKYAAGKGVHATPTAFVNGAYLDSVPFTVPGWMRLLNQIYDSQYKATSSSSETETQVVEEIVLQ